jgi:hypothetical protein
VFVHGRIDLLARRRGRLVVRDYKYATPTPAAAGQYADQLGAYRLAVGEEADAELLFLRGGPIVHALPALAREAEERALVDAADALGAAMVSGDPGAFPKRPPAVAECLRLGCGYVGRCWGVRPYHRRSDPGYGDAGNHPTPEEMR